MGVRLVDCSQEERCDHMVLEDPVAVGWAGLRFDMIIIRADGVMAAGRLWDGHYGC